VEITLRELLRIKEPDFCSDGIIKREASKEKCINIIWGCDER
jgi:hypothetical protein